MTSVVLCLENPFKGLMHFTDVQCGRHFPDVQCGCQCGHLHCIGIDNRGCTKNCLGRTGLLTPHLLCHQRHRHRTSVKSIKNLEFFSFHDILVVVCQFMYEYICFTFALFFLYHLYN
ncbi:hypothetical protein GDO78_012541 [Eleutherodactylus coqui]|uniref:Uncharacterized protein n=1 Tax=Eleutherodactylus coqui TaxID=57060 RepID=A0A8J6K426_ELECQ|nr:hypothetical protein GDO78_012541 [Eleutherodactylus coqui]